MDIEFLKNRFPLVNLYGPSAGDNPEFFVKVFNYVRDIGNQKVIQLVILIVLFRWRLM